MRQGEEQIKSAETISALKAELQQMRTIHTQAMEKIKALTSANELLRQQNATFMTWMVSTSNASACCDKCKPKGFPIHADIHTGHDDILDFDRLFDICGDIEDCHQKLGSCAGEGESPKLSPRRGNAQSLEAKGQGVHESESPIPPIIANCLVASDTISGPLACESSGGGDTNDAKGSLDCKLKVDAHLQLCK